VTDIPLTRSGVLAAHAALQNHLFQTPLLPSPSLSALTGFRVLFKPENIQRAGSFKVRGSVNKIRKLVQEGGLKEVVAASAGNHAQGVAYAAGCFELRSTIFMPLDAPAAKKRATESMGARVELEGRDYDESREASLRYATEVGAAFIDGYDDWDVIEGQATVGAEIAQALGEAAPGLVVVPAGGGGLLAGIAFYLKEVYGDRTAVVGVQSERAPALAESLRIFREGRSTPSEIPRHVRTEPTIADGIRIGKPGQRPFQVVSRCVDDIVCVSEPSLYEAILHLFEHSRLVVEGAGAAGVAALLEGKVRSPSDATAVVVLSGGNLDTGAMQKILTSHLFRSQRRTVLRIQVKDTPGQLVQVLEVFARQRLNVTEIQQPPVLGKPVSPEHTVFDICVETDGPRQIESVHRALEQERERMRAERQEPFDILQR
jgi:threonine dehydratase